MPELAEQVFNLPVRRGVPQRIGGLVDVVNSPVYATGVGLIIYGSKNIGIKDPTPIRQKTAFSGLFERIKMWFSEML